MRSSAEPAGNVPRVAGRTGIWLPAGLEQLAYLRHRDRPELQHLLVRALVGASERPVAERQADLCGVAELVDLRHRLRLCRHRHTREPCPREVLEPVRVGRARIERLGRGHGALARIPAVEAEVRGIVLTGPGE